MWYPLSQASHTNILLSSPGFLGGQQVVFADADIVMDEECNFILGDRHIESNKPTSLADLTLGTLPACSDNRVHQHKRIQAVAMVMLTT